MPGTLSLRPLSANLTRDTELFGKMDPYCKILLGKQKVTGQVCKNGGKHPTWDETLVLKRTNEPNCILELKEYDWLLPDGTIGECRINLNEIESKARVLKWYPLTYTGKPVGQILLEINYDEEKKQPLFEVPPGFTEVKKPEEFPVPSGFTEVPSQNAIHQDPGFMHGYNAQSNQYGANNNYNNAYDNNNFQYQQPINNYQNQNLQPDIYAPPIHDTFGDQNQKYPTFESQYYGNNNVHNQATGVHETIDYRTQKEQQAVLDNQHGYRGYTNEPLGAPAHRDRDTDGTGGSWNPMGIIRGALGRK